MMAGEKDPFNSFVKQGCTWMSTKGQYIYRVGHLRVVHMMIDLCSVSYE